ncbi:DNA-directed RNA polymerase II subunit Rpb1 [Colletotrichum truncatum]|uniref:DNA-directed RNA polymerase II subunit Rpb1 n=1 Tax=Colletotrichum truncatum TaxID=5467 RepID=A0ACC3YTK9_COLTU|nr:DNA-directed RNA polymerase II subunit Rpb1 [Colletotrichum truncatum]KAF6798423.1 DNA-directed RNA polymerase II subunit Rpb1 [Colletotrichum truncatum]
MDAHALLSSQGWRGKGHSLHATDDSIGLAKPLLLNRKDNTKGLGTKAHFTSDTWWMNAFDEQLQGLDTSKKGRVTQTVTQGRLNQIEKVSGGKWMLYASFVRGGFLEGTIKSQDKTEESGASTPESEETSSDSDRGVKIKERKERGETKEERRARKAAKKARKEARDTRRRERLAKRAKRADKGTEKKESKEEKRTRREAKKAKREARKAGKGASG